eukprot:scaffold47683_cov21-Tisochrysis_lutea.AAC.2
MGTALMMSSRKVPAGRQTQELEIRDQKYSLNWDKYQRNVLYNAVPAIPTVHVCEIAWFCRAHARHCGQLVLPITADQQSLNDVIDKDAFRRSPQHKCMHARHAHAHVDLKKERKGFCSQWSTPHRNQGKEVNLVACYGNSPEGALHKATAKRTSPNTRPEPGSSRGSDPVKV